MVSNWSRPGGLVVKRLQAAWGAQRPISRALWLTKCPACRIITWGNPSRLALLFTASSRAPANPAIMVGCTCRRRCRLVVIVVSCEVFDGQWWMMPVSREMW